MPLPGARRPRRGALKRCEVRRLDPPDRLAVIPSARHGGKVKPAPSRAIDHRDHVHDLAAVRASRLRAGVRDRCGIAARATTPAAATKGHTARLPAAPLDQTVEPTREPTSPNP
jgi:hypothetical protein